MVSVVVTVAVLLGDWVVVAVVAVALVVALEKCWKQVRRASPVLTLCWSVGSPKLSRKLYDAVKKGDLPQVSVLLDAGGNPNAPCGKNGMTAGGEELVPSFSTFG